MIAVARRQTLDWLAVPLLAFLVTRLLIVVMVLLADVILPGFNGIRVYQSGSFLADFTNAWDRWDTPLYTDIVDHGYRYVPGNPRNTVVFYPLYPLAMSALKPLTGSALLAGLLISNTAFLAALIVLYRLAVLKIGDEESASRTVFLIAAFPLAFFFSAAYTESLFLLLSVACCYYTERRAWLAAGVLGALASATRPTGFLLVIVVGYAWLEAQGWTLSRVRQRAVWQKLGRALRTQWQTLIPILLIPLGLLLYMLFLSIRFGDPLASFRSQAGWRQPSSIESFLNDMRLLLAGKLWVSYIMDTAVFLIVMALIVPMGRKFGAGYALYSAAALLIPAFTGVMSMTRFTVVLFPVFMLLAVWARRVWLDRTLRVAFLALLPLFTLAFLKNVFVG